MINEANEPSSACRLWRISQVETSAPPANGGTVHHVSPGVKQRAGIPAPERGVHAASTC